MPKPFFHIGKENWELKEGDDQMDPGSIRCKGTSQWDWLVTRKVRSYYPYACMVCFTVSQKCIYICFTVFFFFLMFDLSFLMFQRLYSEKL